MSEAFRREVEQQHGIMGSSLSAAVVENAKENMLYVQPSCSAADSCSEQTQTASALELPDGTIVEVSCLHYLSLILLFSTSYASCSVKSNVSLLVPLFAFTVSFRAVVSSSLFRSVSQFLCIYGLTPLHTTYSFPS